MNKDGLTGCIIPWGILWRPMRFSMGMELLVVDARARREASRWSRCTGRQGVLRKVRAPQGRLPGNAWAPQGDGQGHRKQTAPDSGVRVKRWGKSPPRAWQQAWHGNPQSEQGQVSSETRPGSFELRVGRVEVVGDSHPREMTICPPSGGQTELGLWPCRHHLPRRPSRTHPSGKQWPTYVFFARRARNGRS